MLFSPRSRVYISNMLNHRSVCDGLPPLLLQKEKCFFGSKRVRFYALRSKSSLNERTALYQSNR